ncbi:hypothetical protein M758_1G020900 [Ceratodon purpureus]|nr:hypothetical protein M758_1G020900 [Ceratodon purpureus]
MLCPRYDVGISPIPPLVAQERFLKKATSTFPKPPFTKIPVEIKLPYFPGNFLPEGFKYYAPRGHLSVAVSSNDNSNPGRTVKEHNVQNSHLSIEAGSRLFSCSSPWPSSTDPQTEDS